MDDHRPGFVQEPYGSRVAISVRKLLRGLGRSGSGISRSSGSVSSRSSGVGGSGVSRSSLGGRSLSGRSLSSRSSLGRSLSRLATAGGQGERRENGAKSELRLHLVFPKK